MMTPSLKMTASAVLVALCALLPNGPAMADSMNSMVVAQIAPQKIQIRVADQMAFRDLVLSKSGAVVGVMNGEVRPLREIVQLLDQKIGQSPAVICLVSSGVQVSSDIRFGDDLLLKSIRTKELSSSRETELTLSSFGKMSIMAGCLKTDHTDLKIEELKSAFKGILEITIR
jgi:hypothetical protein